MDCFLSGWLSSSSGFTTHNPVGKGWDVLGVVDKNGDSLAESNVLSASGVAKFGDVAVLLHFKVNGSFIGFDAAQCLAWLYLVTDLLVPHGDVALLHCWREVRHF